MLATLSPTVVEGPEWVFEEKYDGIRAVAGRERGRVRIWSRTLQDLTGGFPHVVAAVEALGNGDLLVDGELVALDPKGVSRFQLLQRRGTAGGSPTRYAVFDLLEQSGTTFRRQAEARSGDSPGETWVRRMGRAAPVASFVDQVWPAVTAEGPDRGELARLGPPRDRLRVHTEHRGHFRRRQELLAVVLNGFHAPPPPRPKPRA